MDDKIECPYCHEDFEVDTDDGRHYEDGGSEEDQCPNCEKNIIISSSCTWYREAFEADCLNGSPHLYSEWTTYWVCEKGPNLGKFHELRQCHICDHKEWEYHDKRFDTRPSERFDTPETK